LQQKEELLEAPWVERCRIRRQHAEDGTDEPPHFDHRAAVLVVGLRIEARMARDFAPCLRVVVDPPQIVAVRHRRERAIEWQDFEAVARQVQFPDDFRAQQRDDVRADGEAKALEHLFGNGGAAEDMAALEHEHLPPGFRQICRGCQAVVPTADDDDVVSHPAHRRATGARSDTLLAWRA
jgi:hypothetical protein